MTETKFILNSTTETERGDVHCIHLPQYMVLWNVGMLLWKQF